jgi:hypothetical protein
LQRSEAALTKTRTTQERIKQKEQKLNKQRELILFYAVKQFSVADAFSSPHPVV